MARKAGKYKLESRGLLSPARKGGQPWVAGLDEAGRGCLAGPVVAAAVVFAEDFDIIGLGDSKTLTEKERTRLAGEVRSLALGWGIGLAWMAEIARHNILQASLLAMSRAIAALRRRAGAEPGRSA
jgi:ribonuclease HII